MALDTGPFRAAYGPEQDGITGLGSHQRIDGQRLAMRIDRGTANQIFLEGQVRRQHFSDPPGLFRHFRSNPVTGQ